MNELRLHALSCPQCGAAGAVREGTRITECERCGVPLCLTGPVTPRYEAEARFDAARAVEAARAFLGQRRSDGDPGRPELLLIPFHEIAGRRTGVFQRTVPKRKRVQDVHYGPDDTPQIQTRWVQEEHFDTKVLLSDVGYLSPAVRTRWDLAAFDPRAARRAAILRPFQLAEAQRRATVFAEEITAPRLADRRFGETEDAKLVAVSHRTVFFPFWSVPVRSAGGSYEVLVDGTSGAVVAWELPEPFPARRWPWLALALPGTLALGVGLRGFALGASPIDPGLALLLGLITTGTALWWSSRPDWRLSRSPDEGGAAVS